ncbi:MAG: hypothetical protein A3J06_00040 [Candidatus Moranbacteria bacterium RIFCSPLOWO2_02_FULL_48_19]|nr:MAG: hypothetical protein A3J06_00040 [Candidatus Moranbacteria bacterium RIFCSPLOWO2_02_FULL_48_19]
MVDPPAFLVAIEGRLTDYKCFDILDEYSSSRAICQQLFVIPAKAGIQVPQIDYFWIPGQARDDIKILLVGERPEDIF